MSLVSESERLKTFFLALCCINYAKQVRALKGLDLGLLIYGVSANEKLVLRLLNVIICLWIILRLVI